MAINSKEERPGPGRQHGNRHVVEACSHSYDGGSHAFKALPGLIRKAIDEECWKSYWSDTLRQTVSFGSFAEYITAPRPEGLGADVDILRRILAIDPEILAKFDKALGDTGEKSPEEELEDEWIERESWPLCPSCGFPTDIRTDDGMARCSTCPDVEPIPFAS